MNIDDEDEDVFLAMIQHYLKTKHQVLQFQQLDALLLNIPQLQDAEVWTCLISTGATNT